jgi:hypothetical protein
MDHMTTAPQAPTTVQVLAARLRVKADKRLKRDTPADIKSIAEQPVPDPVTRSA